MAQKVLHKLTQKNVLHKLTQKELHNEKTSSKKVSEAQSAQPDPVLPIWGQLFKASLA